MKAKDIRKGTILMHKGAPHRVLDFQHRTPGNLRAFVQATLRNVLNGIQTEERFSSTSEVETVEIYTSQASYLYADDFGYHFMNTQSFEEVVLSEAQVAEAKRFLEDNMNVELSLFNDRPIGIQLPKTVVLTIVETAPELRGATASNSPKPATTHTGLVVSVPPFLKVGDRITVDTTDGAYLSRAD